MAVRASIVIPVYNGANYLCSAIDSALAQTYPHIEVIVVNDGSTDGGQTDAIAKSYGERIRYICKPNGGVASALNAGIAAMSGDIFCWLSHDDRHLPEKTAKQVAEWERLGCRDLVLISDYRLIDKQGGEITTVRLDHKMLESKPWYALLRGSIHGCSVFVPRRIFTDVGTFDESLPTTQDYDLWFRIIQRYRFVHMPEVLIESRWHSEQGSKKIDHTSEATSFWVRTIDQVPVDQQERLEGSRYLFLRGMAEFLSNNGLTDAAAVLANRAESIASETLVTIVIPFFNRVEQTLSALESALRQTHPHTEIILVDDGSTDDISRIEAAVSIRPERVRLMHQPNCGPAAARNAGWKVARGTYVAFLDSDDLFLPTKIEVQLQAMQKAQLKFSHTSYYRFFRCSDMPLTRVSSGVGNHLPGMIAGCTIATPTVMLWKSLIEEGFAFPEGVRIGEDIVLWLKIAAIHGVEGLDEALTVVRASDESAAYDKDKQAEGLISILTAIQQEPVLAQYQTEIAQLRSAAQRLVAEVGERDEL